MDEEAERRERRLAGKVAAPLSHKAKIYLDLAAERVAAADLAADSNAGVRLAQEAIGYVAFAVAPHLERAYPTTDMETREQWLSVLRFLSGTLMFQRPLEGLTLALTELDRGITPDGLKPSGSPQGGLPSLPKLHWMRTAVEIVAEVVRQHGGNQSHAEQFIADETGISASTLRKWRKKLSTLAPEHHPRSFRRYMPPPAEAAETDDERADRLAPLVAALRLAAQRAKTARKKNISLK